MGRSARILGLLRPYSLLFAVNMVTTVVASVLDGATFVLLIPVLRTLFGLQAEERPEDGDQQHERRAIQDGGDDCGDHIDGEQQRVRAQQAENAGAAAHASDGPRSTRCAPVA